MPTYQYQCSTCRYEFETLQSMRDKKLKKCPECGKLALNRLIGSGSGVIFKGSGFYETDYKKKDSGSADPSKAKAAVPSSSCGKGSCGCH